ncbi:hypothetical protein [Leptospira kanakyensis]|uniref:hypothetical protein n=1 Tax=Leptospira kanakyensis TaxID=2484968 RepID=UPI00223E84C1|nr:hypothetical protein [Leptospira kanakyensis]MCW7471773.1 hypothetical protein [Leptospira kanakyensis]
MSKETKPKEDKKSKATISGNDLPRVSLSECIALIQLMHDNVASGSISFDDLAILMGSSKNTTKTKYLIWGADAYGLLHKNEKGEYQLSETGRKIIAPTYPEEDTEAKRKSVLTPNLLSKFFLEHNGYPIPQETFLVNKLESKYGIPRDRIEESIRLILDNGKFAKIIIEKEGKTVIALDSNLNSNQELPVPKNQESIQEKNQINDEVNPSEFDKICFIVCPIGEEDSTERKHSDMVLKHLIEPVLQEFDLKAIRSDKIEKTGLITQQILIHLAKSKLCIVDLSFNNPNVFYELGVRHTCLLPSIQIIRKGDKIPFDVSQGRTIKIDTSDPYTMIDRIESAKKELKEYINSILSNTKDVSDDNPIKVYLPNLKISI